MNELISILMPFKNCAPFLKETLDSILAQTYTSWELIAVDDHSEDSGAEFILKNYQDNRIKVLTNEGVGIIKALQTGIKQATGTYITRMDADDLMLPIKLKELKEAVDSSSKKSVAVGLVQYFKSDGSLIGNGYLRYQNWLNSLALNKASFKEVYKECPIPSPSWMMKTTVFNEIGGFNSETYPEDYELAFRMYAYNLEVMPTVNKVHLWRDYDTRTSRTDENYKDNRYLTLKVNLFLKTDYNPTQKLVLLGAGKKGKMIAKLLIDNGVDFEWRCGIPSKIGHVIYNQPMLSSDDIPTNCQVIVAIAAKEELIRIKEEESQLNLYYYFC